MRLHAFPLGTPEQQTIEAGGLYGDMLDDAVQAEELGYHGVWFAEHHFSSYTLSPNPLMLIAAAAARTTTIRLGTGIVVLPMRNPVLVAEEAAFVDQLSGGRLELGVGRGYAPFEFRGAGLDFADADTRLAEGVDLLRHLWTHPDVPFSSSRYSVPALTVTPAPAQKPHPPLWLATASASGIQRALDKDMSIVVNCNWTPAEQAAADFRAGCEARGIDPSGVRFGIQTRAVLTDTPAELDMAVRASLMVHRLGQAFRGENPTLVRGIPDPGRLDLDDGMYERYTKGQLIGTRSYMAEQLARFAELGATDLFVMFRFGGQDTASVRRTMEAIAEASGLR